MKGLMDLLARANLVELSDDEKQPAAEATAEPAREMPIPPPPPPPLSGAEQPIAEDKSFGAIFADAGVADSPFPAEKLLRLLDGLRAMDAVTRKAAVLAMDAADDGWQISDCITDAQQKIAALGDFRNHLFAQLQGAEQQAAAHIADVHTELEAATAAIRQQIAELEQLLERKITQSAQTTTSIEAELRATREAAAREARRMDTEIQRLSEIPAQFNTAAPAKD